jgi:hypothetical protein
VAYTSGEPQRPISPTPKLLDRTGRKTSGVKRDVTGGLFRRSHGSRRPRQGTKQDGHSAEETSRRAGAETGPEIREERRWTGRGASETRGDEIRRAQDERNAKSGSEEDARQDDDEIR